MMIRLSQRTRHSSFLPEALALGLATTFGAAALFGCQGSDSSASTPDKTKIDVPAVEGDVALGAFCETWASVYCAANLGCCSQPDLTSSSTADCMAIASCPVLATSAAFTSGAVAYDAKAAGDYLRAAATSASTCSAPASSPSLPFLVGTQQEAGDCSPQAGDTTFTRACAAGFTCAMASSADGGVQGTCVKDDSSSATLAADGTACEDSGTCQSRRCDSGVCAARLADAAACKSDSDCVSGRCTDGTEEPNCASGACTCAASGDLWCNAATPAPPTNGTWSAPVRLCVTADSSKNSGTTHDIDLGWEYGSGSPGRWGCTIYGGVKTGDRQCCTVTQKNTYVSGSDAWFYIRMTGTDGLFFTKLTVETADDSWGLGTWDHTLPKGDCDGCVLGQDCNECWVDADDHEKCTTWISDFRDGTIFCSPTGWNWY